MAGGHSRRGEVGAVEIKRNPRDWFGFCDCTALVGLSLITCKMTHLKWSDDLPAQIDFQVAAALKEG